MILMLAHTAALREIRRRREAAASSERDRNGGRGSVNTALADRVPSR
jgi:hypothetical protein